MNHEQARAVLCEVERDFSKLCKLEAARCEEPFDYSRWFVFRDFHYGVPLHGAK